MQEIADQEIMRLIQLPKKVDGARIEHSAPAPGRKIEIKLMSPDDPSEKFTLSIAEGLRSSSITFEVSAGRKTTMQTRHQHNPLVRVDLDSKAIHTNPDGVVIRGSHVHIATIEFGDKFAYPLESQEGIMVSNGCGNAAEAFEAFRVFCCIDDSLLVKWSLGV